MKLTWRDAVTLPFMTAIIAMYVAHLNGADGWLLSSTRGNATAILVLGILGGCALGNTADLRGHERSPGVARYARLTSLLGFTALVGGLVALAAASGAALAVLFGGTMALWVLSLGRHTYNTCATERPVLGPENHEVIDAPHVHH